MSLTMTKEERETFLADVHVAVISVAENGQGPLVVPIWYCYEPGRRGPNHNWSDVAKGEAAGARGPIQSVRANGNAAV